MPDVAARIRKKDKKPAAGNRLWHAPATFEIAPRSDSQAVLPARHIGRQSLIAAAVELLPDWTPERFARFMDEDVKRWTLLVRKLGIAID